eukprot:14579723-Heterocapsa_arctica.AAC.1
MVTGQQVEVLVGHFAAACMYKRAGLAVMRSLRTFISDKYFTPTRLWASCRYECCIMYCLCVHLRTSLDLPWSQFVYASDASGAGIGVCR